MTLLPCPFCGAPACTRGPKVVCTNDECFGPQTTAGDLQSSSEQWNKRVGLSQRDADALRSAVEMLGRWFEPVRNEKGQASFNDCLIESIELDLVAAFYPLRELCPHTAIDQQAGCCRKCGIHVEDIGGEA